MKVFCNHIEEETKRLYHMFPPTPMKPLMQEQWREFSGVAKCHICLECFQLWDEKVTDHCHYTGKYRGAAHRKCNLLYAIPNCFHVIFHNLRGYDMHLFIRELGKSSILDPSACLLKIRRSTSASMSMSLLMNTRPLWVR